MTADPSPVKTFRLGEVTNSEDAATNDSDKTLTVPVSEEWDILSIFAELISTATAGNRQIVVRFLDAAGAVMGEIPAGAVQAASVTRTYSFAPGVANQASFVGTNLTTAVPRMVLGPGQGIQVLDTTAVDAAADDMTTRIQYLKSTI